LVRDGGDGEESSHEIVTVAEAIELARAAGLDLVEVNGKASPPVCRLMDYERMRYDQKKRAKEQKKAQVVAQKRDVTKGVAFDGKD
jgi:translation initiation factor IF-3